MNIQSRPTLKKYITLLAIMLIYLPYSCKTIEREAHGLSVKNSFMVNKVKKMSREVYVIYASRNDSIFKIVSFYNGERQANAMKLKKGVRFQAHYIHNSKQLKKSTTLFRLVTKL